MQMRLALRTLSIGLGSSLLACGLQALCWPWIRPFAFVCFYPAVLISAWLGGRASAWLSTASAMACVYAWFLPPQLPASSWPSLLMFGALGLTTGEAASRARLAQVRLREHEAALAEQQAFLLTLTDAVPGLVGYWTKELRCGFANHLYQEWFGRTPEAMRGIHIRELMGEQLYQNTEPHILAALRGEPQRFESRVKKPSGELGYTLVSYAPHRVAGELQGFFVLVSDVTLLRRREEQLRELQASLEQQVEVRTRELRESELRLQRHAADLARSNAALEQLTHAASHELQEPLRLVTSYSQLVERRYGRLLDHDGQQMLGFAADGARRIAQLVDDLLAFTRAGEHPGDARADMAEVTRAALRVLHEEIEAQAATVDVDPALPVVRAREAEMMQVMQELLHNALLHRAARPLQIRVGVREQTGDQVILFVSDTGAGIAEQHRQRIFLAFQQLASAPQGTGIGLALCTRWVEAAGGRLWVESDGHSGSTFCFSLGLAGAREELAS